MKEVTFIMQGPLVSDSIKTIRILKQSGNIVVSCWNTDPANLIQAAANEADRIVINPFVKKMAITFKILATI